MDPDFAHYSKGYYAFLRSEAIFFNNEGSAIVPFDKMS